MDDDLANQHIRELEKDYKQSRYDCRSYCYSEGDPVSYVESNWTKEV